MHRLASIDWNPPREAFTIPFIEHPVMWYGILFVAGFMLGYFLFVPILQRFLEQSRFHPHQDFSSKQMSYYLADRLTWFIIAGAVVGMRLGHVFLYDWSYYQKHPWEIFQVWKGGLASHGGALGVLFALLLYLRFIHKWVPDLTFLRLLDLVVIPTALVGCFIRLGNFINQEIIGIPSQLPWAVVFGNPIEGGAPVARHPVQLYEALAYLATFIFLYTLWKKKELKLAAGTYAGYFFILIFASRFILEFWKLPLESGIDQTVLQTGQLLSLPFILAGVWMMYHAKRIKIEKNSHLI